MLRQNTRADAAIIADDQAKFIYEELIPGVVKRVAAIITKNLPYAQVVADLLEAVSKLFSAMLETDGHAAIDRTIDMADTMRIVFDPMQKFYQHHFLNQLGGDAGKAEAKTNLSQYSEDETHWRENLTVDTLLDAYKEDSEFKLSMWSLARVTNCFSYPISGKLATVRIKFVNDITVPDIGVTIDSDKIAPLGTKREPDEWRSKLKKGDIVDAKDRCQTWYESTVIEAEEREEPLMPMIKVGFRQYHT